MWSGMENASARPKRELSATDLAHDILKSHGQAMYYKDLIDEILKSKEIQGENRGRLIAQIHTEINLDSRFHHKGQGLWALREWVYKGGRVVALRPEKPAVRPVRPRFYDEEEDPDAELTGREADGPDDRAMGDEEREYPLGALDMEREKEDDWE